MWLLEEREEGKRNLDLISDPALIQELISFNMDGNFDRVMGFVGCIIGLQETQNLNKRRQEFFSEENQMSKDWDKFIVNNKNLFNAQFSQTKASLF